MIIVIIFTAIDYIWNQDLYLPDTNNFKFSEEGFELEIEIKKEKKHEDQYDFNLQSREDWKITSCKYEKEKKLSIKIERKKPN